MTTATTIRFVSVLFLAVAGVCAVGCDEPVASARDAGFDAARDSGSVCPGDAAIPECARPPAGCRYNGATQCTCGTLVCEDTSIADAGIDSGDSAAPDAGPFVCATTTCERNQICTRNESGVANADVGIGASYSCSALPSATCVLADCQAPSCPTACAPICAGRMIRSINNSTGIPIVTCGGV